jgi:hypothetical protein
MTENNPNNVSSGFEMLLASDPDMPRWRNSAQWARNTMRQEGLLKEDSPHGTWEITDAGRARLTEGKQA